MNMSILEIIGGILLILTCVLAVILCLLQDSKQQQNMTAAITYCFVCSYDCSERRYSFCKMIINSL